MLNPAAEGLRGDYSRIDERWTVGQHWDAYTPDEHDRWRRLFARQSAIVPGRASPSFLKALSALDAGERIPRLDQVSETLRRATGWRLVAVPGLLPDPVFFDHLAGRRFPVTRWLREERELDYIVEPDIFHDFFGHVPLLFRRDFADAMQRYGERGLEAQALGEVKRLGRLYWYAVEFGLERTPDGLRAFGAGILSSAAETMFAVASPRPQRIRFALERVLRTLYRIDAIQPAYFVMDDLDELLHAVDRPLAPLYRRLAGAPDIAPGAVVEGDVPIAL
jgi:phenylalanine-4-hydroxylase